MEELNMKGKQGPTPEAEVTASLDTSTDERAAVRAENSSRLEKFGLREGNGTVIVISSDRMGDGEETLGRILMKEFLYAISSQDELPETIIFYNSGVGLTVEGNDSLGDLRIIEAQGVELLVCRTSLKELELEDGFKVGRLSDMYDIAERMATADKIIKP